MGLKLSALTFFESLVVVFLLSMSLSIVVNKKLLE